MVVRFCILLFRFVHVCLPVAQKCYRFFPAQEVYGKALSRLSSIISLIGVFPIKRKFGDIPQLGAKWVSSFCGNDVAIKDADQTAVYSV